MKYVLLIYQPNPFDPASYSQAEHRQIGTEYGAVNATPNVEAGLPLGLPSDATTVRVVDGEVVATKGPYVDVAGAVGGYLVFDADSAEEAVALAARVPAARLGGAVEVRPAQAYW